MKRAKRRQKFRTSNLPSIPEGNELEEDADVDSDSISSINELDIGSISPIDAHSDPNVQIHALVSHIYDPIEKNRISDMLGRTAATMAAPFSKEELLSRALCDGDLGKSQYASRMSQKLISLYSKLNVNFSCDWYNQNQIHDSRLSYVNVRDKTLTEDESDDLDQHYKSHTFSSDGFDQLMKFKDSLESQPVEDADQKKIFRGRTDVFLDDLHAMDGSEHHDAFDNLEVAEDELDKSMHKGMSPSSGDPFLNFAGVNPPFVNYLSSRNNAKPDGTPLQKFYSSSKTHGSSAQIVEDDLKYSPGDDLDSSMYRGKTYPINPSVPRRKRSGAITELDLADLFLLDSSSANDDLDSSMHLGKSPNWKKRTISEIFPERTTSYINDNSHNDAPEKLDGQSKSIIKDLLSDKNNPLVVEMKEFMTSGKYKNNNQKRIGS